MLSNNTPLNILWTYAAAGKAKKELIEWIINLSRSGEINLMIDSGAFTYYNAGLKGKLNEVSHINVDDYCTWLDKWGQYVEKYVSLDVIKNNDLTKRNYETMVRRGFNPMWVLTHYDNDWNYLNEAVDRNPHICVAGGANTNGDWIKSRYQTAYKKTDGKIKIHGLGYVKYPSMLQLPLHSVDSSSWVKAPAFGSIVHFNRKENKLITIPHKEYTSGKIKIHDELGVLLDKLEISKKDWIEAFTLNGKYLTSSAGVSLSRMLAIIANLEYQKMTYSKGLRLFLAIGGKDLEQIVYINRELKAGTLKWHQHKKYCRK
jgi:hypothetical protein